MTDTPQPPSQNPAPGYYPDQSGVQRYWDGNAWTDRTQGGAAPQGTTQVATNPKADAKASKAYAKATRPWYKKKRWIAAIVFLLIIIAASLGGGGGTDESSSSTDTSATAGDSGKAAPEEDVEDKEPEMTSGQENALNAAENYLSLTPFSREGLVRQLSSTAGDGYPKADAEFAADNVDVNYKEQAAKAAKNYLDISPFSRAGMIQQLTSSAGDQYTQEQAEYGADKAGL